MLRSPQRVAAVRAGRLDSGEDGASGGAPEPEAETGGRRGGGAPEAAHPQTLQLSPTKEPDTGLLMQFFNILLVSTLLAILR